MALPTFFAPVATPAATSRPPAFIFSQPSLKCFLASADSAAAWRSAVVSFCASAALVRECAQHARARIAGSKINLMVDFLCEIKSQPDAASGRFSHCKEWAQITKRANQGQGGKQGRTCRE